MAQKKDATVTPGSIEVTTIIDGMVDPLDLLVTDPILREASRLTKKVAKIKTRYSSYTINILREFLDVHAGSELHTLNGVAAAVNWMTERAHDRGENLEKEFGKEVYQNVFNLVTKKYLREPSEGYTYSAPALQTTALGVAYMVWHNQLDHDDLLRMLVTGTVKDLGLIPADISDVYTTPYPGNPEFLSNHFLNNPEALDSHTHHLRGADSSRYLSDLTHGVFTKDYKKVWRSLGTVQIEFARHWVHQHIEQTAVADSYLTNEILPDVERIAKISHKLAELVGYTDPEGETKAENAVAEEICRIGWCLLKAAGDDATGITAAKRDSRTTKSVREQLERFETNTKRLVRAIAKEHGALDKLRPDFVVTFDDGGQLLIEHKSGKGRPPSEKEKEDLIERITRAASFVESGDPASVMNYDWDAVEAEIAAGKADWDDSDD